MAAGSVVHRRLATLPAVHEVSNDLVLKGLLAAGEGGGDLSITWVQLAGHHRRLRTDASTRIYVIVEGAGTITADATPIEVAAGEMVVLPPSTPYHLDGAMTYLVINQPGFRDGDDLYLESERIDEDDELDLTSSDATADATRPATTPDAT